MFAIAVQTDGGNSLDLVAGSKGDGAQLGWFESPESARDLSAWKWHPLSETEDLGRAQISVSEASEMTEQLTISIEGGEGANGNPNIVWDTIAATIPIVAH